jgi:hypothetical protein
MKIAIFLSFLVSALLKNIATCTGKADYGTCHSCCDYEITETEKTDCRKACVNKKWKKNQRRTKR